MIKTVSMTAAGLALIATTACASSGNSNPRAPDEFRVVTKAPLVVPPDFNLRPPATGQALPIEVQDTAGGSSIATPRVSPANADQWVWEHTQRSVFQNQDMLHMRLSL